MSDNELDSKQILKGIVTFAVIVGVIWLGAHFWPEGDKDYSGEGAIELSALIASEDRPESHTARDKYRHPSETLAFFDVKPDMKLVEVFPGGPGGFYRRILEPYIERNGTEGAYYPLNGGVGWPADPVETIPYGEIDMALIFRAHGFLIYGEPAQDHVNDLFRMIKPGGYLGIVDHAGNEDIPQDPEGENGYVNESYFRAMAEKAGFKLVKTSDVNRNPLDTKDHPNGLYSLPPTSRGSDSDKYLAIGESDRFTHLYQKPN